MRYHVVPQLTHAIHSMGERGRVWNGGVHPVTKTDLRAQRDLIRAEILRRTGLFRRLYEETAACEAPEGTQVDDVLARFQDDYRAAP